MTLKGRSNYCTSHDGQYFEKYCLCRVRVGMPNGPNAEKKFVQVMIKAEFEVNRLNLKVFTVNAH